MRYFIRFFILSITVILLASCGDREAERQIGIDGYVYVVEEITATGNIDKIKGKEGCLYYLEIGEGGRLVKVSFQEEGEESPRTATLARVDNSDLSFWGGSKHIEDFTVGIGQEVYYFLGENTNEGTFQDYTVKLTGAWLVKLGPDGTEEYRQPLEGLDSAPSSMEIDREGNIYLLTKGCLWMADGEDGSLICGMPYEEIDPGDKESSRSLLQGPGGSVYYYVTMDSGNQMLYRIANKQGRPVLEQAEGINWPQGGMLAVKLFGNEDGFFIFDNSGMFQYSMEDGSWHQKLRWSESGMARNPTMLTAVSEGRIGAYSSDEGLCVLNKTAAEELPEKKCLVLAVFGSPSLTLQSYAAEFNKENEQYWMRIDTYWDETLFDAKLVSSDPPDMVDLWNMDVEKYAKKRMLEDLGAYLDHSGRLGREDFYENILEGYTIGGRLVCIPDSFRINMLVGRASQTNSSPGWTMEELMRLTEEYPEYRLQEFGYAYDIVEDYVLSRFVDWDTGECDFESKEFSELMEWLISCAREPEAENGVYLDTEGLLVWKDIVPAWDEMGYFDYEYGLETVKKGFPTENGEAYYYAYVSEAVGIVASSAYKEGAWEFLEGFLDRDREKDGWVSHGLISRRDVLERQMEDGVDRGLTGGQLMTAEGWVDIEVGITREQADELHRIIEAVDFSPRWGGLKTQATNIIREEMAYYLNSVKSLEEVTAIIQNRVRNLLQENLSR